MYTKKFYSFQIVHNRLCVLAFKLNHFLELLGVEVDIEELPESSLFRFCILYCLLFSDNSMHDFGLILPKT